MNDHYNKLLKENARKLRKNPTKAESKIWHDLLRDRQCMGYRFLRQRAIENYIVDFFSKDLKLVIEVDGITHTWEEVADNDIKRDVRLEELGYKVLRFTDDEVMNDFKNVVRTMEIVIGEIEDKK